MAVFTTAGTILSIASAAPATYDTAGYAALTWTPIGEVVSIGTYGREYDKVTHKPLAARSTIKRKGSFDEGTIAISMGKDTDDAGQILLKTAAYSDADYSFKILYQNGDIDYGRAQVMNFKTDPGEASKILGCSVDLDITTNTAGVGIVSYNAP
jgi:hypothetical protein